MEDHHSLSQQPVAATESSYNKNNSNNNRNNNHRRRHRRRYKTSKRRTMETLRLRSDSDGSTKNAFYQGTIVSDSHQSMNNGGGISAMTTSSSQQPGTRRINNNPPPLPHRRSTSGGSKNRVRNKYDTPPPQYLPDAQLPQSAQLGEQTRDSLRYSVQSLYSTMSQQQLLLGTQLLGNDTNSQGDASSIDDVGSLGSPIQSSTDLQTLEGTANQIVDVSGFPMESIESTGRMSITSIGSGVYFQPRRPQVISGGPIQPQVAYGNTQPRTSDGTQQQYPMQQPNNGQYSSYGSSTVRKSAHRPLNAAPTIEEDDEESTEESDEYTPLSERIMDWVDISIWLSKDVSYDDEGVPYFEDSTNWSLAGIIRKFFYNPFYPEFTGLQQFTWAIVIGVFMGVMTAGWKLLIEACVEFTWKILPKFLLRLGMFTDLNGAFPLYHYCWILPGFFGGALSYIITAMPTTIPTQNDWIHTLHSRGVEDFDSFIPTFLISTGGMASGLSLGPELPLLLTAGMVGSWLGILCRQSMLQARVMNLTAASAAIGGFFGFPMAGAIFVLEVPHRMG